MARRKDLHLDGNGGRFAPFHAPEATLDELPAAPVDIDDLWGDPAPPPTAVEPEPEPAQVVPDDFPAVGEPSGLYRRYVKAVDENGENLYLDPIKVTAWNRDALAGLTQNDIDTRSEAYWAALEAEEEALANRVRAEDVTLPDDPTAEDLRRVATAIDEAFTTRRSMDGSLSPKSRSARNVLAQVYGTEDRAIVALGAAVAKRADQVADGYAHGGAEATEKWWLDRRMELEADERAAFDRAQANGECMPGATYYKSPDLVNLESARDEKTQQALEDMTDAYLRVLAEVRPMGGELKLHEKSSKPGAKVMASTAGLWPADWLDVHNRAATPLHIGASNRRGHYVHHKLERMKTRGQGTEVLMGRTFYSGEISLEPKRRGYQYHYGAGTYIHDVTFYEPMSDEEKAARYPGKSESDTKDAVVGKEWSVISADEMARLADYNRSTRGEAAADRTTRGWELATDPRYNNGEPFYRKKKIRANSDGYETVSQIRLSSSGGGLPRRDARYPVAVHEFGHRMEYLVPNLSEMTHSWRKRRVEESPTEDGRTLATIYRGTREKGYRDEFPDHYVGKVYDHGTNGKTAESFRGATEVFSMGADSVFGGRQGGLIGLSRSDKPDPDMRAFILGCFASAGMASRNV